MANLVDEHPGQPPQVGSGELLVDPVIPGDAIPKIFDDRGDRVDPPESLVQRTFHVPNPS